MRDAIHRAFVSQRQLVRRQRAAGSPIEQRLDARRELAHREGLEKKGVRARFFRLGHVLARAVFADRDDRDASEPQHPTDVLADLVAGLVGQPDVDAYDIRWKPIQVTDRGGVMARREHAEVHARELLAHGPLQSRVVLHDECGALAPGDRSLPLCG